MQIRSRLNRLLAAALAAVTMTVAVPQASAQFGLMSMGGEMGDLVKPSNNARLLKEYAAILSLSPDQKRAADELLFAYQSEFRDNVSRLEEIYQSVNEEIQETADYELYQTVLPGIMIKFMKRADALNKTFMDDLRMLLEPAQLERFPAVERLHRRAGSVKLGLEGLQRFDHVETVGHLGLDAATASNVAATLEQYSSDLDREIVARDKLFREVLEEMAKILEDGKQLYEDPEFMTKWFKEMSESGERIQAVNTRYIAQVRGAIPEAAQQAFDVEVKLTKYPAIYRDTHASRVFAAAEKLPDLDATQREALKTLKESYVRESQTANDKWAGILDELKANQSTEEGMMGGGIWMIRQDPKYVEARDARKAIDDKAADSVAALLTEAQRATLPKKNDRPEWDFDRAPGQ
jgi:hypothetical protein